MPLGTVGLTSRDDVYTLEDRYVSGLAKRASERFVAVLTRSWTNMTPTVVG